MRNVTTKFNEKLRSPQQTPANNADPEMSIQISRARTTVMDSDYWTVETIREKENLGDISIAPRRCIPSGGPDGIYDIHVDNGIVETAIRKYPDTFEEGWKNQFTLGEGLAVGIAFDGRWQLYRRKWRLVTEDKPWITWVDNSNVLWVQLWDDASTRAQLSADISYVKMLRAWKNVNFPAKDQGIVVGYIKSDGRVYYRSRCQQLDYSYVWEGERELTLFTQIAVSLNLFITNDYRMGFIIEDVDGQIHWVITNENWAGMALGAENIILNARAQVELVSVSYSNGIENENINMHGNAIVKLLFGSINNSINAINVPTEENNWGWLIDINSTYPIESIVLENIVVIDIFSGTNIQLEYMESLSNRHFRLHVSNIIESGINNVYEDIHLVITGASNAAGYSFQIMECTFRPINLIPVDLPLPEVLEVWNE